MDFFIEKSHEAVLDLALYCEHPPPKDDNSHKHGKDAHSSYMAKVTNTLRALSMEVSKDSELISKWKIKVSDIMKDAEPVKVLEVPGTTTTLNLRLQVRSLGAPSRQSR